MLKNSSPKDKQEFKNGFEEAFKKLLPMLDNSSQLEIKRKCLSNAVNKYLKL